MTPDTECSVPAMRSQLFLPLFLSSSHVPQIKSIKTLPYKAVRVRGKKSIPSRKYKAGHIDAGLVVSYIVVKSTFDVHVASDCRNENGTVVCVTQINNQSVVVVQQTTNQEIPLCSQVQTHTKKANFNFNIQDLCGASPDLQIKHK